MQYVGGISKIQRIYLGLIFVYCSFTYSRPRLIARLLTLVRK